VDLRKLFIAETAARLGPVLASLDFVGPEVIGDAGEYPALLTLRWRRGSAVVETVLVQAYGGDEYVRTERVDDAGEPTAVGQDAVRNARQLRAALDRHASRVGAAPR
jgi:hypothetical protein